jgi:hypothetical protein
MRAPNVADKEIESSRYSNLSNNSIRVSKILEYTFTAYDR